MDKLKFSLILCTLKRTAALENFLLHLNEQSYKNFELIVIDQNPEGFLKSILQKYSSLPIVHVHVPPKGLSQARNVGLAKAQGDVIGFPDDDCWYEENTLKSIADIFLNEPQLDGLHTGLYGQESDHKRILRPKPVEILLDCNSNLFFLRKTAANRIGPFDENFGIGTRYGSSADVDYILRTINEGLNIDFIPSIKINHPMVNPIIFFNSSVGKESFKKVYQYNFSFGALLRKHDFSLRVLIYYLIRPLVMMLLSLLLFQSSVFEYYRLSLMSRLKGYLDFKK